MQISIADINSDAKRWAEFFSSNVTPDYVSHSELQGYRAIKPRIWAPNLTSVLENEIQGRLGRSLMDFPVAADWRGVITATENQQPIGIAFVSTSLRSAVPFGVIEDIIIERDARGKGLGTTLIHWLFEQFQRAKIGRVFLESGIGNERAHELFERLGFEQVSIVMMRELA
jgi:ribosomal protein S18 acetylase RimI-like enzyme